jgi:hypothetical protein
MSTDDRSASRTEARRRARLAARGELPETETVDDEPEPRDERPGFLKRMFPPAPPLPDRPDPLAGFTSSGPLRLVAEWIYLLRRNPLAWTLPGLAAFPGYIGSFGDRTGILSLIGTFLLFGSLIAAGWFGWQRPALFGVAAAVTCFIVSIGFVLVFFMLQGAGGVFGLTQLVGQLASMLYLVALGFLGGWYGGYLRRRQTQLSAQRPSRRRRR